MIGTLFYALDFGYDRIYGQYALDYFMAQHSLDWQPDDAVGQSQRIVFSACAGVVYWVLFGIVRGIMVGQSSYIHDRDFGKHPTDNSVFGHDLGRNHHTGNHVCGHDVFSHCLFIYLA